jgi:hypothetical protein
MANNDVQNLFECAKETSFDTKEAFLAKYGNTMYDYTLNFKTGYGIPHNDNPSGGGPGVVTSNLFL